MTLCQFDFNDLYGIRFNHLTFSKALRCYLPSNGDSINIITIEKANAKKTTCPVPTGCPLATYVARRTTISAQRWRLWQSAKIFKVNMCQIAMYWVDTPCNSLNKAAFVPTIAWPHPHVQAGPCFQPAQIKINRAIKILMQPFYLSFNLHHVSLCRRNSPSHLQPPGNSILNHLTGYISISIVLPYVLSVHSNHELGTSLLPLDCRFDAPYTSKDYMVRRSCTQHLTEALLNYPNAIGN